ncbi:asparaginase [Neisseria sp.]|uniref:asparaginase n=1 Tax=Neisseria sp. TaxID=192066 RepID=UPI0035A1B563
MKPDIFVLYTGGTIGMTRGADGLAPDTALAGKALQPFADRFSFHWHICDPLIDSSAVTLQNWGDWLGIIAEKVGSYDGFLVLHGTDTMAYTANLFALALPKLGKPVVLTGSQWPYDAPDSDAPLNLATAAAAFSLGLRETVIAFNGKLFPAVGSSKASTETADGFANRHFGAIGTWSAQQGWRNVVQRPSENVAEGKGGNTGVSETLSRQDADENGRLNLDASVRVVCRTLTPGFAAQDVSDGLKHTAAQALILQSYGHGNAPSDPEFIQSVQDFTERGGLVLNISQVPCGRAAAVYAQGSALRQAGVVGGGKCNLETATALLTLAVSNGWNAARLETELLRLGLVEAV